MTNSLVALGDNLFGAAFIGVCLVFRPLLQGWYNHWGATQSEAQRALPGDELVPKPQSEYTRAITIHAPANEVWRWVVQIGQGRAGLYSYTGLENLARCDIHNVDHIVPELQNPAIGEPIRLGPKGYPLFKVVAIQPERAFVLVAADPKTEQPALVAEPLPETYTLGNWIFFLDPINRQTTRLIVRGWVSYAPDSRPNWLIWNVFTEPIGFVMIRKMLLGIKRRAERTWQHEISRELVKTN